MPSSHPNPVDSADSASQARPARAEQGRATGIFRLMAWLLSLGFCWLVVLPWVSRQEPVARNLVWLEERGIDPSAMYYTELEAMKPILRRLNARARSAENSAETPMHGGIGFGP